MGVMSECAWVWCVKVGVHGVLCESWCSGCAWVWCVRVGVHGCGV